MLRNKIKIILFVIILIMLPKYFIKAYWQNQSIENDQRSVTVEVGNFPYITQYDPNHTYTTGDMFIYDGRIWVVYDEVAFGKNQRYFLRNDGTISTGFLMWYNNGLNEVTPYWVWHNHYIAGDRVIHNGIEYEATVTNEGIMPTMFFNIWRVVS